MTKTLSAGLVATRYLQFKGAYGLYDAPLVIGGRPKHWKPPGMSCSIIPNWVHLGFARSVVSWRTKHTTTKQTLYEFFPPEMDRS